MDFSAIKGQEHVKRALEVAAAGRHGILLIGPSQQGKTLLADAARELAPVHPVRVGFGPFAAPETGDTLVAETWPCACGGFKHDSTIYPAFHTEPCTCTPEAETAHVRGLVHVLATVDMICEVPRLRQRDMDDNRPGESTERIRARVWQVRETQRDRYTRAHFPAGTLNGDIEGVGGDMIAGEVLERDFALGEGAQALLRTALRRLGLSEREGWQAVRVARTIADLDRAERITTAHISEAIQYRGSRYLRDAATEPAPATWLPGQEIHVPGGNRVGKTLAGERAVAEAEAAGATIHRMGIGTET